MMEKKKLVPESPSMGQLSLIEEASDHENCSLGIQRLGRPKLGSLQFDKEIEQREVAVTGDNHAITVVNMGAINGEEFSTGLFGCLSRPVKSLVATMCPCIAELYVGWTFRKRLLGVLLALVTCLLIVDFLFYFYFESYLIEEEEKAEILIDQGVNVNTGYLHYLRRWSLALYLILLNVLILRFLLYLGMRKVVRDALSHQYRNNPELCNSPDFCAVLWCSPCVLCQHLIATSELEKSNTSIYARV